MKKIDTSKWQKFIIGDLFDIHPTQSYKMTNAQLLDGGKNPVVVNSSYNNGIGGYSTQKCNELGNIITFSDTTTADAIFYQPQSFVGYPHVQGMYPKKFKENWNELSLLFFLIIFKKTAKTIGFDYGFKFTREIASKMSVALPSKDGKEPDWDYMQKYMSEVIKEAKESQKYLSQVNGEKHAVDIANWKRFHLYDEGLFEIDMGTKLDRVKMTQVDPKVNFVGRANANNGITAQVDRIKGLEPYAAGNMTLSLGGEYLGSCFVQPESFYTSQNVVVLKPKQEMSFAVKQFIATMIFRESRSYYKAFIDELNRHIKTDFSFYLPVDRDGKPDLSYMDSYMKELVQQSENDLNALQKII